MASSYFQFFQRNIIISFSFLLGQNRTYYSSYCSNVLNIQFTQQVQLEVIVVELIVAGGSVVPVCFILNKLNNRLNIRERFKYCYQTMFICLFHVCVSV